MILECVPLKEIIINGIRLPFGTARELVRAKLGGIYEEQNEVISLGDDFPPIIQRRDVYNSPNSYFFLNYDQNDNLMELEVHQCKRIKLYDVEFNFTDELDLIVAELSHHAPYVEEDEGSVSFESLKICLMDERQMGGEESNILSYFYCASSVE